MGKAVKLKELITEALDNKKAVQDWLSNHVLIARHHAESASEFHYYSPSRHDEYVMSVEDDGKSIVIHSPETQLIFDFNNGPFIPCPGNPEWDTSEPEAAIVIQHTRINDWSHFPNVGKVEIGSCVVDTWKGIDKAFPHCNDFQMYYPDQIAKNILHIIKMQHLQSEDFSYAFENDDDANAVFAIIHENLGTEDMLELQNKLIDSGFEEWSKL